MHGVSGLAIKKRGGPSTVPLKPPLRSLATLPLGSPATLGQKGGGAT